MCMYWEEESHAKMIFPTRLMIIEEIYKSFKFNSSEEYWMKIVEFDNFLKLA